MRIASPLIRYVVAFVLVAPAFLAPALAQQTGPVSATDGAAIRKVIEDQIAAFKREDGVAAFGFASPDIRETFGSADQFMNMVRSGYQPVYRPRRIEFGAIEEIEGTPAQHVWVVGPDGEDVEAIYYMQRQPDGSWRINGCDLRRANNA